MKEIRLYDDEKLEFTKDISDFFKNMNESLEEFLEGKFGINIDVLENFNYVLHNGKKEIDKEIIKGNHLTQNEIKDINKKYKNLEKKFNLALKFHKKYFSTCHYTGSLTLEVEQLFADMDSPANKYAENFRNTFIENLCVENDKMSKEHETLYRQLIKLYINKNNEYKSHINKLKKLIKKINANTKKINKFINNNRIDNSIK